MRKLIKSNWIICMAAILCMVALTFMGCPDEYIDNGNGGTNQGGNTSNPFVGTWEIFGYYDDDGNYVTATYTFNADMSWVATTVVAGQTVATQTGTYKVSGNAVILLGLEGHSYRFDGENEYEETFYVDMPLMLRGNSLYYCSIATFTKQSGNGTSANPLAGTVWAFESGIVDPTSTLTFNADMTYVTKGEDYSEPITRTYRVAGNTVFLYEYYYDDEEMTCLIDGNTLFVGIDYDSPFLTKQGSGSGNNNNGGNVPSGRNEPDNGNQEPSEPDPVYPTYPYVGQGTIFAGNLSRTDSGEEILAWLSKLAQDSVDNGQFANLDDAWEGIKPAATNYYLIIDSDTDAYTRGPIGRKPSVLGGNYTMSGNTIKFSDGSNATILYKGNTIEFIVGSDYVCWPHSGQL